MEGEWVRVKGGHTSLLKIFGGVIVRNGFGNSSFGGGHTFSVSAAVGGWARELCPAGCPCSLWISLSSAAMELGGAALGTFGFRYFFKPALRSGGSDGGYFGGGGGLSDD